MALNTVTLKWNVTDLVQGGQTATLIITPTAQLTDTTDHVLVAEPVARRVIFSGGTGQLAGIIANDNANITPSGAGYLIEVVSSAGQVLVPTFQTQILFANGASQWLDALAVVPSVTTAYQFLPLPTGTPTAGQVPVATGTGEASAWGNTGDAAPVTLTDGATIAVNAALSDVFRVTLGGNRTLANPTNPTDGQTITVEVIQDATGSRTLSYGGAYSFTASTPQPSLSTTAGDRDLISFFYDAGASEWICAGYVLQQNGVLVTIAQGGTGQTTQQAAINALTGVQTSGQYLRSNGTNAALAAIVAADLPTATTSTQGAVELDGTAADITVDGTQAAGAVGKAADAGHIHPATGQWYPADNGLLTATDLPGIAVSTATPAAGTIYLVKLPIRAALTATYIWFVVGTGGTGASTGSYVGLYSSAGSLLSSCSDIGTQLTTSAVSRQIALTTPQALTAGTFVWVALVVNLASTQPTLRAANNGTVLPNINLTAAAYRIATNGTGTSLPGSITPSANSGSSPFGFWFGIS
jgi:hypothetical protein